MDLNDGFEPTAADLVDSDLTDEIASDDWMNMILAPDADQFDEDNEFGADEDSDEDDDEF